ncbi:unnamed protein product, partial [Nesidiocoris tenuis]
MNGNFTRKCSLSMTVLQKRWHPSASIRRAEFIELATLRPPRGGTKGSQGH